MSGATCMSMIPIEVWQSTTRDPTPRPGAGSAGRAAPVLETVGPGHAAACLRLSGYLFGLF